MFEFDYNFTEYEEGDNEHKVVEMTKTKESNLVIAFD